MDFYELIKSRESVRNYDPTKPVDMTIIERILEAGRMAPSAANRQPFRFLVISTESMLKKVRQCYSREWFCDAPHILVVIGNVDEAWKRASDGYNSLETDVAIAMDHMILAAEQEGVATCWIAAFDPVILKDALQILSHEKIFAITPLGYPREGFTKKNVKQRKPLKSIVEFL